MITLLLAAALLPTPAAVSTLPDAPKPHLTKETKLEHRIRITLLADIAAARTMDWVSTAQCVREPYSFCHEVELPKGLAGSKPGLAAFELGMTAGEVWLSGKLAKKHPKLAILGDALSFTATAATVAHNYSILDRRFIPLRITIPIK